MVILVVNYVPLHNMYIPIVRRLSFVALVELRIICVHEMYIYRFIAY